ncbi:MAG: thiamine phosphate synthase [Candidatus Binatia bacterium]
MATPAFDLYLVTDRTQTRGHDLLWVLEQALAGGVKAVQLREKDLGGKELFQLAENARRLCERYDAALFINDRVDVALAVDAAGVQLGKASLPIETVRSLLGPQKLIGASIHSIIEGQQAERGGADFVLFGPVYFTPSKASFGAPQGLTALANIVEMLSLPVYAIGGITADNTGAVRRLGVRGVALIAAIISAENPHAAAQAMIRLLRS